MKPSFDQNTFTAHIKEIVASAYDALDVKKNIKSAITVRNGVLHISSSHTRVRLGGFKKIFLIAVGKRMGLAARALADVLEDYAIEGIALTTPDDPQPQGVRGNIKVFYGTHPIPSSKNVTNTSRLISLLSSATKNDLVLFLIGGGGSSLLCASEQERAASTTLFSALTKKGATIHELNIVRKHLSVVKGGGLAKIAYPATVVSLIASDVCGNSIASVASGPTVYDATTISDALAILGRYGVNPTGFVFTETPKDKKYFKKNKSILFVRNQEPIRAMKHKALSLGYHASVATLSFSGEARSTFISFIKKIKKGEAIIFGGETTVHLSGRGIGGRNQEAVLGALCYMQKHRKETASIAVASFASDGRDNTPVAGAFAHADLLKIAERKKLFPQSFLATHNSFAFFKKIGGHIAGSARTFNVSDLMFVLKK